MTARSPRDKLIEAMAEDAYAHRGWSRAEFRRMDEIEKEPWRGPQRRALESIEAYGGGCWIAPNLLTRDMRLQALKAGARMDFARDVYGAFKDHAPYAAEKKDATNV